MPGPDTPPSPDTPAQDASCRRGSGGPRRGPRAARVVLDHDLPPYSPTPGDIVLAYHPFDDPETISRRHAAAQAAGPDAPQGAPDAKFRPCMVVATKDDRAMLVPISSRPERSRRHQEISEPSELAQIGLAPHKPAYAKVLETTQYDLPHPLIVPQRGDDGTPSWTLGRVPRELLVQTCAEIARQKKHGRLETIRSLPAAGVPEALTDSLARTVAAARPRHEARATRVMSRAAARAAEQPSREAPGRTADAWR